MMSWGEKSFESEKFTGVIEIDGVSLTKSGAVLPVRTDILLV